MKVCHDCGSLGTETTFPNRAKAGQALQCLDCVEERRQHLADPDRLERRRQEIAAGAKVGQRVVARPSYGLPLFRPLKPAAFRILARQSRA